MILFLFITAPEGVSAAVITIAIINVTAIAIIPVEVGINCQCLA